jgi:4,5-DOPA dioxygenase extradiol
MDSTSPLPALFASHGSPMIALEPGAAGAALQALGRAWRLRHGQPRAILTVSAHTAARGLVLLGAARHAAIHDFGNFDPRLFTLRYDVAGAPALAERSAALLQAAGLPVRVVDAGGLDHGAWTVLRYLFPDADVPVLPLAFRSDASPAAQFALGEALAPLRQEGVMLLASGSITHNLQRVFAGGMRIGHGEPEQPESAAFRAWMLARSTALDWRALFDYRRQAPHALAMHPTDEHLLPWFVAAGAGGRSQVPHRLHSSVTHGCLGMDLYAFGEGAQTLADTLPIAC